MQNKNQINLRKMPLALLIVLSLSLSSIGRAQPEVTCDGLLTECSLVVEKLQTALELQTVQTERQQELIEVQDKEIKRQDKSIKTVKSIAWGEALLLLLLLL